MVLKFRKYVYFPDAVTEKRILLVGAEDSDDTNEMWLSVSPLKLRIATRNVEDYENDTIFECVHIEQWKKEVKRYEEVYEGYWRHKRFWEFLVEYFEKSYKKIQVEWVSKFGVNKAIRYEFFRHEIDKGKYDRLVNEILVEAGAGLWDWYQLVMKERYSWVDISHWETEYAKCYRDMHKV